MVNLNDKKILVTGGAGFIGKHLIDNLVKKYQVPEKNIFVPLADTQDLRRLENCQAAVKDKNIVIHLAALTGDIEFHKQHPAEIFYDNIIMGIQLMEAARLAGVEKFVGIGSVTEYPESARAPFTEDQLWNGYPAKSHGAYSFAKKMLLAQGQAYRQQYGFNAIHLLLSTIYGPGVNLQSGYVISSIIERVNKAKKENKEFVEAWGTGRPIRDFLYIDDAVEGILLATKKYDKPDPVNIASGIEISIKDLVDLICRLMDFKGKVIWDASKPDGQLKRVTSGAKAEREFGFRAIISLEEGLKKTIDWYLQNNG